MKALLLNSLLYEWRHFFFSYRHCYIQHVSDIDWWMIVFVPFVKIDFDCFWFSGPKGVVFAHSQLSISTFQQGAGDSLANPSVSVSLSLPLLCARFKLVMVERKKVIKIPVTARWNCKVQSQHKARCRSYDSMTGLSAASIIGINQPQHCLSRCWCNNVSASS